MNDLPDDSFHFFLVIFLAAEPAAARGGVALDLEGLSELLAVDGQDDAVHSGGERSRQARLTTAWTACGPFAALSAAGATLTAGLRAGRCGRLSSGLGSRWRACGGWGAFTRR